MDLFKRKDNEYSCFYGEKIRTFKKYPYPFGVWVFSAWMGV
jgi:hypothetical protein